LKRVLGESNLRRREHETGDSTFSLWWAERDPIMH